MKKKKRNFAFYTWSKTSNVLNEYYFIDNNQPQQIHQKYAYILYHYLK